ncbi:conserved hypothetical protein [Aspergillus terreus NIH2624]|uniref:Major facilitator superfamily (MFS) profile domain-containing protein n=1 Tax=Aspergillus terreus (strain NIH 2624 / FGSC A1156) TaxID=341663 RepID=Q0CR47_ASPTN|nr:uncharacterized protein ATEG_03837 [Aspergillus terreus NIH2624]EAU35639.1 conserved hypothetical protein [Aspergillus terreus NIH2624]
MREKTFKLPVRQLVILSICRFAEPEMIEEIGVSKNEVGKWVGISSAVTSICQATMAVPWGAASDTFGRKPIILTGLFFTMIFSLVFGSSKSLGMLITARAFLGLMNGNVGIIRTMVAEMVPEKELQPRAFSVMPLVWTIGSIFGPAFGGALARPAVKHPNLFGGSVFLKEYPFILPNLASAVFFVIGITTGWLFLQETLAAKKDRRDYGLLVGDMLTRPCTSKRRKSHFKSQDDETTALLGDHRPKRSNAKRAVKIPSWKDVFTPQSSIILLSYSTMAMHNMAFDSLFPVFLHSPAQVRDGNPDVNLPFKFIGGFGVDSQTIGIYYTLIGIIGMLVQFLVFPTVAKKYGVLNCYKTVVVIFPVLYLLTPFTALTPDSLRHVTVFLLMLGKLFMSIFGFPCITILLTNSATSLSVLGTLNGVATSVSAIGRAAGPAICGAAYSFGVKEGYVIFPWWLLATFASVSAIPVFWTVESEGYQGNSDDTDDDYDDDGDDGRLVEDSEEPDATIAYGEGYGPTDPRSRSLH